jgi:hypothetical protein
MVPRTILFAPMREPGLTHSGAPPHSPSALLQRNINFCSYNRHPSEQE